MSEEKRSWLQRLKAGLDRARKMRETASNVTLGEGVK